MERILLQTGECAAIPYCFENLDIRVYSVEELCYVLRENAFLLDREILDKRLVKWIGEGVKLPELASMLAPLLHNGTSAGAFVRVILSYVGLYDEAEIARTEEVYLQGMGLNAYEKLKTRIDYMVENGKYARIMHNKGTALCGLFLFEEAAQWFLQAYEMDGNEESFLAYLAAKRMFLPEGDYVSFVSGLGERYESTLELERRVQALQEDWEISEQKRYLEERGRMKSEGDSGYYTETDRKIRELKDRYRENVNG